MKYVCYTVYDKQEKRLSMFNVRLCAFADEASSSLDGQIRALHRNGISLIELRGVDGVNVAELDASRARGLKARLDGEGISVWSLGSPAGKSQITDDFTPELDRFRRLLETAYITGAECIRLFSFYGTGGSEVFRDEVMLRLSRFIEAARGSGVTLCHENEKGIYGDVAARCAEIHRALPQLRAVFDPANFVQSGENTAAAWAALDKYVYYGHIKDADASGHVVPPGEGVGGIAEYLSAFFTGGREVLTLEPHLTKFIGLSALESGHGSAVGGHSFGSGDDAFDYAATALKKLIEGIKSER